MIYLLNQSINHMWIHVIDQVIDAVRSTLAGHNSPRGADAALTADRKNNGYESGAIFQPVLSFIKTSSAAKPLGRGKSWNCNPSAPSIDLNSCHSSMIWTV